MVEDLRQDNADLIERLGFHAGQSFDDRQLNEIIDAARAEGTVAPAPAPVKAEGERVAWALVPPEPTDEMLAALNTGFCVELPQWKAMLAAAPPPPTEEA